MQKSEFLKYLKDPEKLDQESLRPIMQVIEQYPYFQTARLLAVRNKFLLGEPDYEADLASAAAYVADRSVLYDLLFPLADITDEPSPSLRSNISNLLTLQLEELELLDPEEAELVPEIGIDLDKTYGAIEDHSGPEMFSDDADLLMLEPEIANDMTDPAIVIAESEQPDAKPLEPKFHKKKLIEQFIESNPRLEPMKEEKTPVDISEDSVKEHDGIFTDTLAKIYIKQGYYNKAIFAFEKLILKYPEKSNYFAGQIESIKKLMNKQ